MRSRTEQKAVVFNMRNIGRTLSYCRVTPNRVQLLKGERRANGMSREYKVGERTIAMIRDMEDRTR